MVSLGTSTRELRELLVPTHLHYDIGTASLRTRALAEILTKVLFSLPSKQAHVRALRREVAHLAEVKDVSDADIKGGLFFLNERDVVREATHDTWGLTEEGVAHIETDIESSRRKTEVILDNYFGTKIEREILRRWFRYAAAHFFGMYSDLWARVLCRRDLSNAPSETALRDTLHASIKKYGLSDHTDELIAGFRTFIDNCKDPLVTEEIWRFAQAMLSARLITASIGPDPITIQEFRDATIFFDTNTLFLANLEDEKTAQGFSNLITALKEIGSTLYILPHTKREYERVITHKSAEICKVADCFDLETLKETRDPFLKTALARGSQNAIDIKAFFETIRDPLPQYADRDGILAIENSADIEAAADMAAQDPKRLEEIAHEWKKCHRIPKTRNSVIHDAALDGAAELVRKRGRKAWIITRDTSMQTLSNRWTGSENLPVWISIDALISILALESTGPTHDPLNYAPLLRSLIEADMHPSESAFQIEDLSELLDLEERVKELDKNEIVLFANKVAKLRILGKTRGSSELQLEIRRTFNRTKTEHNERIKTLQEELASKEEDFEKVRHEYEVIRDALVGRFKQAIFIGHVARLSLSTFGFLIIGAVLIYFGLRLSIADYPILVPVLISLGISEIIIPVTKWIIPGIRNARTKARKQAYKKANALVQKPFVKADS